MAKNLPKPKASTQQHLDIEDIADDMVIFKTGWVGLIISVNALNFDLLSEAEQDATIYAYGAFLNSLTFPMQVLVRSKKADITSYFASLAEAARNQPNPDLKAQMQSYEDFLKSIVHEKSVLDKKFYIIINYSPLEGKKVRKLDMNSSKTKAKLLAEAKTSLYPRRDHIYKQMARVGLTAKQLVTKDLIELYYDIYNPAPTEIQRIMLDTESYTTPMVEPAVEIPMPKPEAAPVENPGSANDSLPNVQPAEINSVPTRESNLRPAPTAAAGDVLMPKTADLNQSTQSALAGLREATAKAAQMVSTTQVDNTAPVAQAPGIGVSEGVK